MNATTHEQIKEILKPRIETLGYKLEEYDPLHFDGFIDLYDADIEITDNLLNPQNECCFFAILMSLIGRNPEDEELQNYKVVLPYYAPGMNMSTVMIIKDIINQSPELLDEYLAIFRIPNLLSSNKNLAIELLHKKLPHEFLLNPEVNKEEGLDYWRYQIHKDEPIEDPLEQFKDPEYMAKLLTI